MALTIGQIVAASYVAVVTEKRKPTNQWMENAYMRELERQGAIVKVSFGETIEETLDYRRNPGAGFLSSDLQPTSMVKTEILTAASYGIAELSAPVVWSKKDEVQNPTINQKVNLATARMTNAIDTHDDLIEEALQGTSTQGFLGLQTIIPTNGQGTVGGIDAGTETWWRNQAGTYTDDTNIEAGMTTIWNLCAKGSGSKLMPTLISSDAETQALFESTQQGQQRYVDTEELKAGFKILAFKTSRYCFTQFGSTSLYFTNPKSLRLLMSKEYTRDLGETSEIPNANGFVKKVYSALQFVTGNKSRLGVLYVA